LKRKSQKGQLTGMVVLVLTITP